MPTRMSIFGFPLKNGWKAVGALYADGVLDAPFEVHGKEPVADWYTRGAGIARATTSTTSGTNRSSLADLGYNTVVREQIEADGYQLFGTVLVNEQPRLRIYTSDSADHAADLPPRTSSSASTAVVRPDLEPDGLSAAIHMQHELDLRLGDGIRLRGYSLDRTEAKPGEGVLLTLYWQAGKPLQTAYSVFTQIIDMTDYHKAASATASPSATNCRATSGCRAIPSSTATTFPSLPTRRPASTGCWSACMTAKPATASTSSPDGAHLGDAFGLADITVTPP